MTKHELWRERQVYEKGDIQRKAELNLEKQRLSSFVEVQETGTGRIKMMKKNVADIMKIKQKVHSPKSVFTVPDLRHIDWNN